jgi:haloalkane dehalogenase
MPIALSIRDASERRSAMSNRGDHTDPDRRSRQAGRLPRSPNDCTIAGGGRGVERRFEIDEQIYPFESRWHRVGGAALHYLDEGEGPAVVMLHGNPTWSFLYRDVIRTLSGRCRAIAPDYPGFGFSESPEGYGYSPAEHAEAIGALVDALGLERFFLVVQDWGGPIGMAVAAERPERVAGFVIANTWCWGTMPASPSMWLFSKLLGGAFGRYWILRHNLFADPRVLAAYTAPFPDPKSRMGTWTFPRAITRDRSWIRSIEARLGPLRDAPVELLWGERDPLFKKPRFDTRWRRLFPDASTERVEDAGHFIQEDRPDRVAAAVLRLLERAPSPSQA